MDIKKMMNVEDTGRELGVSKYTVRSLIRQKRLPIHRIGRRIVISLKDISDFLERNREDAVE